jgi:hypothetical protein
MPFAGQFGAAIQECFSNASLRVFPSNASLLEMTGEKSFIRLLATPSLTIASNFSAPQWHLALLELSGEPMALRK